MRYIDTHGNRITAPGERSEIVGQGDLVQLFTKKSTQAILEKTGSNKGFAGDTSIRLVGQVATLPADLYSGLATLDPTWRPFILDFTRTFASMERVYQSIYDTQESPDFDETMKIVDFTGYSDFGYTEWRDGESVWMNDLKGGESGSVTLKIHAGGYARTMRDELFNKKWRQQIIAKKQAEGYNKFLNHLYMYPIIGHDYTGATVDINTLKVDAARTWWECNWQIMKLAKDAYFTSKDKYLQPLKKPILVMNTVTYNTAFLDTLDEIKFADSKRYTSMSGWWDSIVIYDTQTMKFGDETVEWAGPADGEVYMVSPKEGFKELVKQPLTMIAEEGRASNLSAEETVWWDCRGIIADPTTYAKKMKLIPASDTTNGLKKA